MFRNFTVVFDVVKKLSVSASRSISHHSWKGKAPYKDGSPQQQEVIDAAFNLAELLGFNAKAADEGIIAGTGWHNHTPGGGGNKWITVQYKDDNGNVLWHKKKDGSEWDRIHLYQDPNINLQPDQMPVEIYTK